MKKKDLGRLATMCALVAAAVPGYTAPPPPGPPPAPLMFDELPTLDLPTIPAAPSQDPGPPTAPSTFDFGELSLDLGETKIDNTVRGGLPTDEIDDADPLARKLELADEFRRIGDMEGARDLLEEVVSKADGALKTRAQAMLDDLE